MPHTAEETTYTRAHTLTVFCFPGRPSIVALLSSMSCTRLIRPRAQATYTFIGCEPPASRPLTWSADSLLFPFATFAETLRSRVGRVTRVRRRCHRVPVKAALADALPCSTRLVRPRLCTPTQQKMFRQRRKAIPCFLPHAVLGNALHVFICTTIEKSIADILQASCCR